MLLIRCPSCGQRFKVSADLRDRTVECGSCEHRFRINDDVTLRSRKFYPGEHPQFLANRYQRVPLAAQIPENWQAASYEDQPDISSFEPTPPQRTIAGVAGVLAMVMMALLLIFGEGRGGALDGISTAHQMMIAGFISLMGTVLLLYANPRSRIKALLFSLMCSAGLLALPIAIPEGPDALKGTTAEESVRKARPPAHTPEQERIIKLRQTIGTDPLLGEITKLANEGSHKHAYGLWLRGLSSSNKLLVRDYLLRVANADPSSIPYPRGHNDYLMVVSRVDMTIEKLAELSAPLGEVSQILREIEVIEIRVNNGIFLPVSLDKLTDKDSSEFYDLNKRELDSIDLQRVQAAAKRLAEVEPKLYRNDISRRLIALLKDDGVDFKRALCGALLIWADEAAEVGDAAEGVLKKLRAKKLPIPTELIALLVKAKQVSIIPILDSLWFDDPGTWEQYYADMGPPIETTLIRRLPQTTGGMRKSIVRMLGKVGGDDSLPVLEAAREGADAELRSRIETAEKSIRARLDR